MIFVMFNTISGKKILMFGYVFKKDMGDICEFLVIDVGYGFIEDGVKFNIYDSKVVAA